MIAGGDVVIVAAWRVEVMVVASVVQAGDGKLSLAGLAAEAAAKTIWRKKEDFWIWFGQVGSIADLYAV